MSKYIIELNTDYAKSIVVLGMMGDKGVFTVFKIDELEELTSVKKTEYQRGFEDGKKAFDLLGAERDSEYQRGLDDAWEAARKIVEMPDPPYWGVFGEYKNDLFGKIAASEAINKIKAYEEKQDKIEVGDEVNWLGDCFIVTRIFQPRNMKEQCDGIDDDGCVYSNVLIDDLEKTGRHFDIASILEDMRHD